MFVTVSFCLCYSHLLRNLLCWFEDVSIQRKDCLGPIIRTRRTPASANSIIGSGFKTRDINRAVNFRKTAILNDAVGEKENDIMSTYLPYIDDVTCKVARLLKRQGIKTYPTPFDSEVVHNFVLEFAEFPSPYFVG